MMIILTIQDCHMKSDLCIEGKGLEEIQFLPTVGADKGEWVGTNFERKYIKDKRQIHTLAVKKRG